jgi:hypothetical protein
MAASDVENCGYLYIGLNESEDGGKFALTVFAVKSQNWLIKIQMRELPIEQVLALWLNMGTQILAWCHTGILLKIFYEMSLIKIAEFVGQFGQVNGLAFAKSVRQHLMGLIKS